jgi:quercetin dioxygenase-like cupin family protein
MRTAILFLTVLVLSQPAETSRVALAHALPALDGRHLVTTLVEVTYGPGGSSAPHSHPCPVIGYVVSGSLRSNDSTYTAGQSFYEAPNAEHRVSANASRTQPVTFLAYFTCDHDVGALSTRVSPSAPHS